MAYLIRRKGRVDAEVRRVLLEQNQRALTLLDAWHDRPSEHVHEARQAFKRARALLRLVRPGAPYVYRVENHFYRDLGRNLAYARDTDAVIDALGLLEVRISGPLAQESQRMLRMGLEQRAARERASAVNDLSGRIDAARDDLALAGRRFRHLPVAELRRKDLRRGAELTMARCASDFERVLATQATEDFHAWRKNVKYAYNQTRLMQQLMPGWAGDVGPALGQLADVLGRFHDLALLEALLQRQVDELDVDVHLRSMRKTVRHAKAEFAAEALSLGAPLFVAAPPAAPVQSEVGITA